MIIITTSTTAAWPSEKFFQTIKKVWAAKETLLATDQHKLDNLIIGAKITAGRLIGRYQVSGFKNFIWGGRNTIKFNSMKLFFKNEKD